MNILDFVIKEAHIERWALLQQQQIDNMVSQVFAKHKEQLVDKKPKDKYFLNHSYTDYLKKLKERYFVYAREFNNHVVKKLTIDFKNEKLLLAWLLEQVAIKQIKPIMILEDMDVIKDNLKLYFENKGDIKKNIFSSNYEELKTWVQSYRKGGEEAEHQEFLSKPIAEGKEYKIYKITDKSQCIKIGKGTSWCIQEEHWAESYLKKGPLWLVIKNEKRFALLQFESGSFMDVNDSRLRPEIAKEILSVWPESERMLLESIKKYQNLINYAPDKVQLEAIKEDSDVIQQIDDPSEKVQLAAVSSNGKLIRYIKKPSVEAQMAAVNNKWVSLHYIENPDPSVVKRAIERDPRAKEFV